MRAPRRPHEYAHPYRREKETAEQLKIGLALMVPRFTATLCPVCGGEGQYYRRMEGTVYCSICKRHGLLWGSEPATSSVVNQVLVAAERVRWLTQPVEKSA